jgi:transcriptional regulator with XRE-family HTH domain
MTANPIVASLLSRFRDIRQAAGLTPEELDARLIFGPGWVRRFETGDTVPSIDVLVVMLAMLNSNLREFIEGANLEVPLDEASSSVDRVLRAEQPEDGSDALLVKFRYADHDATYRLPKASLNEFDEVLRTLRDGLAQLVSVDGEEQRAIKTNAVAASFLRAAEMWPHANPSDLWWFVVSRAYLDRFNHPARYARLDHGQSWKRTGGWALEEVLVRHYSPALAEHWIRIFIAYGHEKHTFLGHLETEDRLEADKVDVLLVGATEAGPVCFGVVHVKASFAERRTDDVPMSKALVEAGYCSPLWTMDCKSSPSPLPINRGELGPAKPATGPDRRSAKRKDIEDDGYFSACFSYNRNTVPTPETQDAASRIMTCDFTNPSDDAFVRFVRAEWERFQSTRMVN